MYTMFSYYFYVYAFWWIIYSSRKCQCYAVMYSHCCVLAYLMWTKHSINMVACRSMHIAMPATITMISPVSKQTYKQQYLKTVDTIGNCQWPVFSLGVSKRVHKITNLWKFELNWWSKSWDNNERKNTLVTQICVQLDGWFRYLKF